MLRPDTGNYNRFLTSLGLLLLAAALIVPYFYFQSTDTLRIPAKELNALTETSKDTLEGRQDAIAAMELFVVGFSAALAACGVFLLVFGGRRLRSAQVSEEEEDELRKSRARAEIRQLSPRRLEEKRDEQAKEAVAGSAPPDSAKDGAVAGQRADAGAQGQPSIQPDAQPREREERYRRRREAIVRIEERIAEVLADETLPHHKFFSNVRVTSTKSSQRIELDGLFEAVDEKTHRDVIVEVRLWQDNAMPAPPRRFGEQLLGTVARYQAVLERPAVGWLLIVVPREEQPTKISPEQVQRRLGDWFGPAAVATVIEEEGLAGLPMRFTAELLSSGLTDIA